MQLLLGDCARTVTPQQMLHAVALRTEVVGIAAARGGIYLEPSTSTQSPAPWTHTAEQGVVR